MAAVHILIAVIVGVGFPYGERNTILALKFTEAAGVIFIGTANLLVIPKSG
jgi:hypothetical protein